MASAATPHLDILEVEGVLVKWFPAAADARIMTFGYNADAAFEQSTAKVVDHAKSFVGQLGGQETSLKYGTWRRTE